MKRVSVNSVGLIIKETSPKELGEFLAFLVKHEYDVSVTSDGYCYIVEFDNARYKGFGNPINVWVDPEEYEMAISFDDEDDDDDEKDDD